MKILFLNPSIQSTGLPDMLRGLGVAVLTATELREAELTLKLHGRTISLVVGHDELGTQLNEIVKSGPRTRDIAVILTTSKWSEGQCIQHQATPHGANAYVRMPIDDRDFIHVIDEVMGTRLSHGEGFNYADDLSVLQVEMTKSSAGPKLEIAGRAIKAETSIEMTGFEPPKFDLESTQNKTSQTKQKPLIEEPRLEMLKPDDHDHEHGNAIHVVEEPSVLFTGGSGHAPKGGEHDVDINIPLEAAGVSTDEDGEEYIDDPQDEDYIETMPYLSKRKFQPVRDVQEPLDDAVVPGGAVNAPDAPTLKRTLLMREQDVAALSNQLRQAREHIRTLEKQLKSQKALNSEFSHLTHEQSKKIENFEKEKEIAIESYRKEADDLRFEMKKRVDKIRVMEHEVTKAVQETEKLKERVRQDIRKIRTREKELENRLEIMKRDSEALLAARETKIVELKRKLDLTEFNMDILQDQFEKEKRLSANLREKLAKAAQVVRVAGGLLHPNEHMDLSDILPDESKADKTSAA